MSQLHCGTQSGYEGDKRSLTTFRIAQVRIELFLLTKCHWKLKLLTCTITGCLNLVIENVAGKDSIIILDYINKHWLLWKIYCGNKQWQLLTFLMFLCILSLWIK